MKSWKLTAIYALILMTMSACGKVEPDAPVGDAGKDNKQQDKQDDREYSFPINEGKVETSKTVQLNFNKKSDGDKISKTTLLFLSKGFDTFQIKKLLFRSYCDGSMNPMSFRLGLRTGKDADLVEVEKEKSYSIEKEKMYRLVISGKISNCESVQLKLTARIFDSNE